MKVNNINIVFADVATYLLNMHVYFIGAITNIDVSQDASTIVFGTTQKTIEIWTTKSV